MGDGRARPCQGQGGGQKTGATAGNVYRELGTVRQEMGSEIDSVPQVVQVARHHGDAQTNKPTKRDGRVVPLISLLHNADKASADPPIG